MNELKYKANNGKEYFVEVREVTVEYKRELTQEDVNFLANKANGSSRPNGFMFIGFIIKDMKEGIVVEKWANRSDYKKYIKQRMDSPDRAKRINERVKSLNAIRDKSHSLAKEQEQKSILQEQGEKLLNEKMANKTS